MKCNAEGFGLDCVSGFRFLSDGVTDPLTASFPKALLGSGVLSVELSLRRPLPRAFAYGLFTA